MERAEKTSTWVWWGMALILAAYAVYAGIFIYRTSFVYDGQRIFTLFDDATISMQYARNLAHGFGPVWNAGGARVEGFTNPLWVGYMALLHLLPVPETVIALLVQITGAILMLIALVFVMKIAAFISDNNPWIILFSVFTTAFYYPLSNWSLMGTEVSVLLVMTLAAAWLAIRTLHEKNFHAGIYLLMGISTLVRMDMVVGFLVIWAFLLWFDKDHRARHLLWGALSLVVFLGGQTLLRLWYYGDALPNTYYLKMTGMSTALRLQRGIYVLGKFAWNLGPVFAAVPFFAFLFKRNRYTLLMLVVFLGQCAYSVYVGGDAWEHRGGANRFIALGMPFFMILFSLSSVSLFGLLKAFTRDEFSPRWLPWMQRLVQASLVAFVFFCLVNFNSLLDGNSLKYWVLLQPSVFSVGSQRYAMDGLLMKYMTTPNARLLVGAAGNVTYFSDRFAYDEMGKADRVIAREDVKIPDHLGSLVFLQPGHNKYDYAISIGQYRPDVLVELKPFTRTEYTPYLEGYEKHIVNHHEMFFLTGSKNVLWDRLQAYEIEQGTPEIFDEEP